MNDRAVATNLPMLKPSCVLEASATGLRAIKAGRSNAAVANDTLVAETSIKNCLAEEGGLTLQSAMNIAYYGSPEFFAPHMALLGKRMVDLDGTCASDGRMQLPIALLMVALEEALADGNLSTFEARSMLATVQRVQAVLDRVTRCASVAA